VVEQEPELEHAEEEQREKREEERELDQPLTAIASVSGGRRSEAPMAAHRTGSIRIALLRSNT
jgi:hypothetical protein